MDFDYEGAEDFGGRILWGRIAVFGAALLLMLILGRCTAGGGASQAELDAALASASEAQVALEEKDRTIAQLQQELIEARAQPAQPTAPGDAEPGTTPADPNATQTDAEGNRTYEVQPGDTLSTIAQAVYGDPTAFGIIAQANNLGGNNLLQVGDILIIPPNPDQ
jgi:nucleoid-associated protein YgaU